MLHPVKSNYDVDFREKIRTNEEAMPQYGQKVFLKASRPLDEF